MKAVAALKLSFGIILFLLGGYCGYVAFGLVQDLGSADGQRIVLYLVGAAIAVSAGLALLSSGLRSSRGRR